MRLAGRNLCRSELEKNAFETVISSGVTGRVGYIAAYCGGHLLGGRRASARRLQQMRPVLGRLDAAAEILQVGSSLRRVRAASMPRDKAGNDREHSMRVLGATAAVVAAGTSHRMSTCWRTSPPRPRRRKRRIWPRRGPTRSP